MSVEGNFCTHINGRENFLRAVLVKTAVYFLTEMEGFLCPYYLLQEEKICS